MESFEMSTLTGGIGKIKIVSSSMNLYKLEDSQLVFYVTLEDFELLQSIRNNKVLSHLFLQKLFPQQIKFSSFDCKTLLGNNYNLYKQLQPLGVEIQ